MPKAPANETYEQKKNRYTQSGYNVARGRKQNRDPVTKEVITSEDDLWEQAAIYADKMMEKDSRSVAARRAAGTRHLIEDEDFRKNQEALYRDEYEWNDSNDESSMYNLIELEVQIRQINRELDDSDKTSAEKEKLRTQLREAIKSHRELQGALGIDKPARDKKSTAGTPMDDWARIKDEAKVKKDMMREEFLARAAEAKSESDLRDKIKAGLLLEFQLVDSILSNHRRVLDLPTEVEKS